jgi:hypothetical protein
MQAMHDHIEKRAQDVRSGELELLAFPAAVAGKVGASSIPLRMMGRAIGATISRIARSGGKQNFVLISEQPTRR